MKDIRKGEEKGGSQLQAYCAVAFHHDEALLDLADVHGPGAVVGTEHVQVPHLGLERGEYLAHVHTTAALSTPLPMPSLLTRSSCNRATIGLPSSQQSSLSSGMKGHQMILRKWFSGVPSGCRIWTKISSLSGVLRIRQVHDECVWHPQRCPPFFSPPFHPKERILNFAINQSQVPHEQVSCLI